jgi:hypothetical protein
LSRYNKLKNEKKQRIVGTGDKEEKTEEEKEKLVKDRLAEMEREVLEVRNLWF